jgi:hypothetical protein
VDADIVHAENKSDDMMTIKISMRDFFIEIPLLVGLIPHFILSSVQGIKSIIADLILAYYRMSVKKEQRHYLHLVIVQV